jgi:hypothetical protein
MTRFDSFCLHMIVLCLAGAFVFGGLQYHDDIRSLEYTVKMAIPGCRSKYDCTVHYEHARPVVEMVRKQS